MRSLWSKAARRLHVLAGLRSPSDALLFARALSFAAVVPLLARLPLPRLQRWIEPRRKRTCHDESRAGLVLEQVTAALGFGRPVVRPGCLTRGLTLYRFLREVGIDVELCFGMGVVGGGYEGHCWLVRNGEPFMEPADPRPTFVELYRIPVATER